MRIVLLADNRKNELLINFCIAYKQLLKRHQLLSTLNLARLLEENVGLNVTGVPSDLVGGLGQITQRVGYNEIDAVIHLRDTRQQSTEYNKYSRSLLDICDVNTIPYASNIATAEILILAIDCGEDYSRTDFEQASGTQKLVVFVLENNFIVVECSKLVQLAEITNFANFEDLVDYGCSLRHWLRESTKEETN